jgi:hypothetical protein
MSPTRSVKDSISKIRYRPTHSSSELRINVSELHADEHGRLEISCVSTIPAEVGRNEEFADFRVQVVRGKVSFTFTNMLILIIIFPRNFLYKY